MRFTEQVGALVSLILFRIYNFTVFDLNTERYSFSKANKPTFYVLAACTFTYEGIGCFMGEL